MDDGLIRFALYALLVVLWLSQVGARTTFFIVVLVITTYNNPDALFILIVGLLILVWRQNQKYNALAGSVRKAPRCDYGARHSQVILSNTLIQNA